MGHPSESLATLRPDLSGGFIQFDLEASRRGFIWQQILPVIEAGLAADAFPKIKLESLLRDVDTKRNPRAGYGRDEFEFEDDSYATVEHGWEEPIDDNEARRYRHYFDFEQIAAGRTYDAVLRHAERRVAALLFNTTTYTGSSLTTAVDDEWDDLTNADPVADIEAAKEKVWSGTGLDANALVINKKVFENLRRCENVIDKVHSEGAGQSIAQGDITAAMLARVFNLPKIIVAGASRNSANVGQTRSIARIWSSEYAWIGRVAETNDLQDPCIGRTFHWAEDGSDIMGTFETYRDEKIRSDVVRVRNQTHEKILYTECGHLLTNITTEAESSS